ASPQMPDSLNDRATDIREPLLALADLAGGDWPSLARQAAVSLNVSAQESNPISSLLLCIFALFTINKTDRMFTRSLVEGLNSFADRPWAEMRHGKQIHDIWLSQQLRPYGIRSQSIWIGEISANGYLQEYFIDIFHPYIAQP